MLACRCSRGRRRGDDDDDRGKARGQKPPSKYSNFVRPDSTKPFVREADRFAYVRTPADTVREKITFARIELEGFRPDELDLEGIAGFAAGFGERGTAVDCGNA